MWLDGSLFWSETSLLYMLDALLNLRRREYKSMNKQLRCTQVLNSVVTYIKQT